MRTVQLSSTNSRALLLGLSFEAMLYFLYTNEIRFAPFSSDHELPAQAKVGDWSTGKLPSPSAKSIYRLADKVISLMCLVLCTPWLNGSSTIYQTLRIEPGCTSSTIWNTATSWKKSFPVSRSRQLPLTRISHRRSSL